MAGTLDKQLKKWRKDHPPKVTLHPVYGLIGCAEVPSKELFDKWIREEEAYYAGKIAALTSGDMA